MKKYINKGLSVFLIAMILVTSFAINTQVFAEESNNQPILSNGGFENEIDINDIQAYKGQRVDASNGQVRSGDYSMKIGAPMPEDNKDYPLWFFNGGKGSVGLTVRNVQPYSKYKVKGYIYNETGVSMRFGVMDIEGVSNIGTSSGILSSTYETSWKRGEWEEVNLEIITGPRTTELYIFALTEWTNTESGAGVFYVDDVSVNLDRQLEFSELPGIDESYMDWENWEWVEKITRIEEMPQFIEYNRKNINNEFPITMPQIHSFIKSDDAKQFNVDKLGQLMYADSFSMDKATYFGDKLVEFGITKTYTILSLEDNPNPEQGIVISQGELDYNIPSNHEDKRHEAYQINIEGQTVRVEAEGKAGIQNALATLLQALKQQAYLPSGTVEDYPTQRIRGLQVDTGRRYYSIDWLKNQIEQMAYQKLNKLQLRLKDNEGIRYESKVAPQFVDTAGGFWTQEEVKELVHFAQQFEIEIIPEVDFPGHSEQDGVYFDKSWLLVPEGTDSRTLDFSLPEVRQYMADVYKEAFDLFESDIVHMGGDEYFQTKNFNDLHKRLSKWAIKETGNENATAKDAFKLFFNELAEPYLDEGKTVLVWNDNIDDLSGPAVKLDERITIDFWAGGYYSSIEADDALIDGYQIMSSPHPLYQDLWPNNSKFDNPLPSRLYNDWNQYTYPTGVETWEDIDPTSLSLGQMYPIWDDAHGYVSEYILTRGLFHRLSQFSNIMWGSDRNEDNSKKLSFRETERAIYQIGTVKAEGFEQVNFEYTQSDLDVIKDVIKDYINNEEETALRIASSSNDNPILAKIDALGAVTHGERTNTILDLIYDFENMYYQAPQYGQIKVVYVDDKGNAIGEGLKGSYVRSDFDNLTYNIEPLDIAGYTFKEVKEGSSALEGIFNEKEGVITFVYTKDAAKEEPVAPTESNSKGKSETPKDGKLPSTGMGTSNVLFISSSTLLLIGGSIYIINKRRKNQVTNKTTH